MYRNKILLNQNNWNKLLHIPNLNKNQWISVTNTKNYLIGDSLVDWLELYYHKSPALSSIISTTNKSNPSQILFEKGFEFENKVCDILATKFKNEYQIINSAGRNGKINENYNLTLDAIHDGIPIISQAVLLNDINYTSGCADLLVRSDYINKLTLTKTLNEHEINIKAKNLKKYHYRVIDIKWSTLPLLCNSSFILNKGLYKAYKGQLALYNCTLGIIQGYFPNQSYLLGKGLKSQTCNKKFQSYDCFDRLGIVDFLKHDIYIFEQTVKAIEWYRKVMNDGKKWNILEFPPKKMIELCPNMNIDSKFWNDVKFKIAEITMDPTLISGIGTKERDILFTKKIYKIDHPKFCKSIPISKNKDKIKMIVLANIGSNLLKTPIIKISKQNSNKIMNNDFDWKTKCAFDMYFDFESINMDFVKNNMDIRNSKVENLVYMIGVGYIENNVWKYKNFSISKATRQNEKKMFIDFIAYLNSIKQNAKKDTLNDPIKLFHWSQSEITIIKTLNNMWNGTLNDWIDKTQFIDMHAIINKEKIGIKGSYGYSLKSVGNALYNHGLIKTFWQKSSFTDISNGQDALFAGSNYYKKFGNVKDNNDGKKIFNDFINYNEIDCKMIYEIVRILRQY